VQLREPTEADRGPIRSVVEAAFGRVDEAQLVDAISASDENLQEWVVVESGRLIGHVLASPIRVSGYEHRKFAGIAPLSVLPAEQNQGVGSVLMAKVIEACRGKGLEALFLLGAPDYYQRFGFKTSHIGNEYGATDAFMHLELVPDALGEVNGVAHYVAAFGESGV
jgi:putative acetyltransferase